MGHIGKQDGLSCPLHREDNALKVFKIPELICIYGYYVEA